MDIELVIWMSAAMIWTGFIATSFYNLGRKHERDLNEIRKKNS